MGGISWQKADNQPLFYKGLHGLAPIPVDQLRHPSRFSRHSTTSTFIPLSSRIDAFKYSFIPGRWWIGIRYRMKIDSSSQCHLLSALPSCYWVLAMTSDCDPESRDPGPFTSPEWHPSGNGRMPMAGHDPKLISCLKRSNTLAFFVQSNITFIPYLSK